MSLGPALLPVPDANWFHQNGGGVNLTFNGAGSHRVRWAVAAGIPASEYSYRLEVKFTNEADGMTLVIGGTSLFIAAASAPGVYTGVIESAGVNNLVDVRAEDVTAIFSLQVWPGTE